MAGPTKDQQTAAYMAATAQVRAAVQRYANAYYAALGSYRDSDIDRLVEAIVPRVLAGQIRTAELTSAYIAGLGGATALAVDRDLVTLGRGLAPDEVYRRPGKTVYRELATGATVSAAIAAGRARLESLVGMDLQMAKVRQADASMQESRFPSYRRVLTGNENCALCVVASTQRYNVGNLMPIHPGCDCGVEPITSREPIPHVIDEGLLEATHLQVGGFAGMDDRSARAPDYRQLIVTHDHGEHGPSLRWRGQKFTGADDI